MTRWTLIISCLAASWFVVFLMISNHWGQALMYSLYGSLVFSLTLLVASFALHGVSWRTFWMANFALIMIFGGIELYALSTLTNSHAARFGGARLSIGGRITTAGFASIAFDTAICTLANFAGFYFSRLLIHRLNIE